MTTPRVPDACSLSQPAFEKRLRWIRDEIRGARRRLPIPGGVAWEFDADPERRAKLERLVALESDCCDGDRIHFALHVEPDSLRLEVRGIDADALGPTR
ncbi:MAG: hypothetical protein ACQGVC_12165 [Myxococcota bacterium]